MARGKGQKRAQLRILKEIRDQLVLQAQRWGRADHYSQELLEEYELEAAEKIRGQFLSEKSNLEYELHLLGSDKKQTLIKIERLNSYINKAERVIQKHVFILDKMFENKYGAAYKALKAIKTAGFQKSASVTSKK